MCITYVMINEFWRQKCCKAWCGFAWSGGGTCSQSASVLRSRTDALVISSQMEMFVDICRVFMCVRCSMALVEPHVAVIIKRALRYFRCQSNIYRRLNGRSFPQRAARKLKFECSAAACVIEYVPRTRVYCPPSRRQRCARPSSWLIEHTTAKYWEREIKFINLRTARPWLTAELLLFCSWIYSYHKTQTCINFICVLGVIIFGSTILS